MAAAALLPVAALALPDGAPWSEAGNSGGACTSCHFDSTPIENSPALSVAGFEGPVRVGETYSLTVQFRPDGAQLAGFLASFQGSNGQAGVMAAEDGLEAQDSAVRSTIAKDVADRSAQWNFRWTAPEQPASVILHLAAIAANDDASPLGDTVHWKLVNLEVQ